MSPGSLSVEIPEGPAHPGRGGGPAHPHLPPGAPGSPTSLCASNLLRRRMCGGGLILSLYHLKGTRLSTVVHGKSQLGAHRLTTLCSEHFKFAL